MASASFPSSSASSLIITVVGVSGRLGGHVVYMLLKEFMSESPIIRLLSTEKSKMKTEGISLDLMDSFPSFNHNIEVFTDMDKAFKDSNYIILLASLPKQDHYERHDLLPLNTPIYQQFISSIAMHSHSSCLIAVVANPVIDLCRIMAETEPNLKQRISAVVAVDQLRAERQASISSPTSKSSTTSSSSSSSSSLYVLGDHSVISPMKILGNDDIELHNKVQNRGREIILKSGGTAIYSIVESIRKHSIACLRPYNSPPLTMGIFIPSSENNKVNKQENSLSGKFLSVPGRLLEGKFCIDPVLKEEYHNTFLQYTQEQQQPSSLQSIQKENSSAIEPMQSHPSSSSSVMNGIVNARLSQARTCLNESTSIYFLIGAGLSVDCGIPHIQGKFKEIFPTLVKTSNDLNNSNKDGQEGGEGGDKIETIFDISNISAFQKYPKLAWGFFGSRALSYMRAKPSESYTLLKQLIDRNSQGKEGLKSNYFIETTNIDHLFVKSGLFQPECLYERHGTIFDVQCTSLTCIAPTRRIPFPEHNNKTSDNETTHDDSNNSCSCFFKQLNINEDTCEAMKVPLCLNCNNIERPATVLAIEYGLKLHDMSIQQEMNRKLFIYENLQLKPSNVVIIEIGVGTQTSKLRHRSSTIVKERRAQFPNSKTTFIRVNPIAYDINKEDYGGKDSDNISLPMTAYDFLANI